MKKRSRKNCVPILIHSCTGRHHIVWLTKKQREQLREAWEMMLPHNYLPEAKSSMYFTFEEMTNET